MSVYLDTNSVANVAVDKRENLTFDELVELGNADCIKCFFVNKFCDKKDTLAATWRKHGIVMSKDAGALTLAHELGHEFGASDIYNIIGSASMLTDSDSMFWYRSASRDWSNGCQHGGPGYYRRFTKNYQIILSLLMYGHGDKKSAPGEGSASQSDGLPSIGKGRDITLGPVYGVRKLSETTGEKGDVFVDMDF